MVCGRPWSTFVGLLSDFWGKVTGPDQINAVNADGHSTESQRLKCMKSIFFKIFINSLFDLQTSTLIFYRPSSMVLTKPESSTLIIRGVLWNARKSMWKIYFSRDCICSIFLKCPKIEHFQFLSIFCSNSYHVLFFWNARFSYVRLFWNAQFSIHYYSRNSKCSIFGKFKKIEHMQSREKNIFHILVRAFHKTSRRWFLYGWVFQ